MATCKKYTENILNSESMGDSLIKINNNFINLQTALCDLQKRINDVVKVRTFFYYGPNSVSDATSGMQDNVASRPSDNTIQTFVNTLVVDSVTQANVPEASKKGDIVYVIYQKTGYVIKNAIRLTTGTTTADNGATVPWSTTSSDNYTVYSPVFIIWRLTFNGTNYTVDSKFPKYSQAETVSTEFWNQPQSWLQY